MKNIKINSIKDKQLYVIGIGDIARRSILNLSNFNIQRIKYSIITQSYNNCFGTQNTDSINLFSKSLIKTKNTQKEIKIKPKTISEAINTNVLENLRKDISLARKVFLAAKISSDFEALVVPEVARIAKYEGTDIKCIILNPFDWEGTYINKVAKNERRKLDSLLKELIVLSLNKNDMNLSASFSINGFLNELSERLTFALISELKADMPEFGSGYNQYSINKGFKFSNVKQSRKKINNIEYHSDTNKWKFY